MGWYERMIARADRKLQREFKKIDKEYQKDIRKISAYCQDKESFNKAVSEKRNEIIVKGNLYKELLEIAKKSQKAKTEKNIGTIATAAGLLVLPGISAWVAFGGGIIAIKEGKNKDYTSKYKITIDELNQIIKFERKWV